MNWSPRGLHCLRSTTWQFMRLPEARVSVANAHLLISECASVGTLSFEFSTMVLNVMTKDHIIELCTHRIATVWVTRIREGRMSTSIRFLTNNHGRAEIWRVCYRPTVDGLDRSKIAQIAPGEATGNRFEISGYRKPRETAPGWRSVGLDGNTPTRPDQSLAAKSPPGQSACRKAPPETKKQEGRKS
jgi:hypothetical protein